MNIKIFNKHSNISKFYVYLLQQRMLYRELNPLYSDTVLCNITDLLKAIKECKGVSKELTFNLPIDIIWNIHDNLNIDDYFFDPVTKSFTVNGYNFKAIVILKDGLYMGHGWYFTHDEFPDLCGVHGVKSSIINTLVEYHINELCPFYRTNIIYQILQEAIQIGSEEGRKILMIPNQIDPIDSILDKLNFIEIINNNTNFLSYFKSKSDNTFIKYL